MRLALIPIISLLCCSTSYSYETDCQGKWENNETVRVKINWTTEKVKVNDINLSLNGPTKHMKGIATSGFTNKLGEYSYFTIGNFGTDNHNSVFIQHVFSGFFSDTFADSALLTCTKGFNKPFKEIMMQPE